MTYRKFGDIVPFGLRMQPDLKEKLEKLAKGKPKWSLNAEIIQRLEESLTARHDLSQFTDGELIDELIKRRGKESVHLVVTVSGISPQEEIVRRNNIEK